MADLHTEARAVYEYVSSDKSLRDVADEYGLCHATVGNWAERHGVPTKGRGRRQGDPRLADEDWLRERYVGEARSTREIADAIGCSQTAVHHRLESFGIDTRSQGGGSA